MDRDAGLASIRNVALFHDLSDDELAHILATAKEVRFPAGKEIARQGGPGVGFHMVLEGEAEVTVDGEHRTSLGPGDYFGEVSLIDDGPRTATVATTQPTTTLSITSWEFTPLLDRYPSITRKLLLGLCRRLRAAETASR